MRWVKIYAFARKIYINIFTAGCSTWMVLHTCLHLAFEDAWPDNLLLLLNFCSGLFCYIMFFEYCIQLCPINLSNIYIYIYLNCFRYTLYLLNVMFVVEFITTILYRFMGYFGKFSGFSDILVIFFKFQSVFW